MGQVSIWYLIVTNAFTLAAAILAPWMQSRAKAADIAQAKADRLCEKAAEVFRQVGKLKERAHHREIDTMRAAATAGAEINSAPWTDDLAEMRGLLSIYFPSLLPRLNQFEGELLACVESQAAAVTAALQGNDVAAMRGLNYVIARTQREATLSFARDTHALLADAVRPHSPA